MLMVGMSISEGQQCDRGIVSGRGGSSNTINRAWPLFFDVCRLPRGVGLHATQPTKLGRKGDGEPEAKTLWLGLQEVALFVEGARYAREFSYEAMV